MVTCWPRYGCSVKCDRNMELSISSVIGSGCEHAHFTFYTMPVHHFMFMYLVEIWRPGYNSCHPMMVTLFLTSVSIVNRFDCTCIITIVVHFTVPLPDPINGQWSTWSEWSRCTAECGGGIHDRYRLCNSPPPSRGGHECIGNHQEWRVCNNDQCQGKNTLCLCFKYLFMSKNSSIYKNYIFTGAAPNVRCHQ